MYRFIQSLVLMIGVALAQFVGQGSAVASVDDLSKEQGGVALPPIPVEAGLVAPRDAAGLQRAGLTWEQVIASIEPAPWPKADEEKLAGVLPHEAAALIAQSETHLHNGQAFRAVQLLREAETLAPKHQVVLRALGLAYAESGNLTRAASYLSQIVASDRDDLDALIVLARHAVQSGSLADVITYSAALAKADAGAVADDVRVSILAEQGYTAAASQRLAVLFDAVNAIELDALAANPDTPPLYLREARIIKATLPQLRIQQGDLLLQLGQDKRAAEVYASIAIDDAVGRYALAARQAYLALRANDQAKAIDQAIDLLRDPSATADDAQLIAYLLDQGVSKGNLTQRTEALLRAEGVTLPRLIAFSYVAEKQRLLEPINAWLSDGPVTPERLSQSVSLIRFDDNEPADALALAELLKLVAKRMQRSPAQATDYAKAAIDQLDAPVTLLRAIRSDAFTANEDMFGQLLAAVAYEHAGRRSDALRMYLPLLASDALTPKQVLLPAVRLQLALGQGEQAHALLGQPAVDSPWDEFELALRAMAAAGKARDAVNLVNERIQARGKQLDLDVLRIKLIAQMGQPQEACNLLLRLISSQPNDESLYRLGIDLAYVYRANFNRLTDAERMRRAFLTRLISNLPEAPLSRMSMAQNIKSNPARIDEAKQILLEVLDENPDDAGVLSLLVELYDEAGDEANAQAMFDRYAEAVGPGVSRALLVAERAVSLEQNKRAVRVIEEVFELDDEGVLPGRAMTGDDASSLLHFLETADPERKTDSLYLAMLRRFPDHAGLNNALGYRWAVQGQNLNQAKAMIERALKDDPTNHSILDSDAWVHYKLGEFDKAKAIQSRALLTLEALLARLRGPGFDLPDDAAADFGATTAILNDHMGDILYKLGDTKQALNHWRVAAKQPYTQEQEQFDPELRTLDARLKAKIDALADGQPVPVAPVPGPESHGPEGHPADLDPAGVAPGG